MNDHPLAQYRLLLYYKGDISALTMFAQQADGNVCFPHKLPALSSPLEEDYCYTSKVALHPSVLLNNINQQLNLDNEMLSLEAGFCEYVDTPGGIVSILLARFNVLDPPRKLLSSRACQLKTLPELRGRTPAEMELLRRAYVKVMES